MSKWFTLINVNPLAQTPNHLLEDLRLLSELWSTA